jgi:hypothetical protein
MGQKVAHGSVERHWAGAWLGRARAGWLGRLVGPVGLSDGPDPWSITLGDE